MSPAASRRASQAASTALLPIPGPPVTTTQRSTRSSIKSRSSWDRSPARPMNPACRCRSIAKSIALPAAMYLSPPPALAPMAAHRSPGPCPRILRDLGVHPPQRGLTLPIEAASTADRESIERRLPRRQDEPSERSLTVRLAGLRRHDAPLVHEHRNHRRRLTGPAYRIRAAGDIASASGGPPAGRRRSRRRCSIPIASWSASSATAAS